MKRLDVLWTDDKRRDDEKSGRAGRPCVTNWRSVGGGIDSRPHDPLSHFRTLALSHSALRSLLTYLALVGVPVAALLGILHLGRGLQAPPPLGGEWTVAASPSPSPATSPSAGPTCAAWGDSLARGGLSISQSGVHLDVTLRLAGERRVSALLRGDTIRGAAERTGDSAPGRAACDPASGLKIEAAVDPRADPRRMDGVVRFRSCGGCAPAAFTATRDAVKQGRGK
jgi:hypothetical protein